METGRECDEGKSKIILSFRMEGTNFCSAAARITSQTQSVPDLTVLGGLALSNDYLRLTLFCFCPLIHLFSLV